MREPTHAGMPRTIRFGPFRYTLRVSDGLAKPAEEMAHTESYVHEGDIVQLRGLHEGDDMTITLREGMKVSMLRVTTVHELLHALIEVSRTDSMFEGGTTEERFVERTAPWLTALLQDNPRLVEFLTDRRQGGAGSATWWRRNYA